MVNTYTAGPQNYPAVASLSNGGFVTTWTSRDQDGDSYGVYGQIFNADGSRVGQEFRINTYTTDGQRLPSVTGLDDGSFVVAWTSFDQDGDSGGVYGQRYNNSGTKIGSEFQINTYTSDSQVDVSLASLKDCGFVATWNSIGQDGDSAGIYGQVFNEEGLSVGEEFQVNTYIDNEQEAPAITGLDDGGFVITWESLEQDGDWRGVYGQVFNASGEKNGDEFQINSYTTNSQDYSTVASLGNGDFVVSWHSDEQDGDWSGVYAQLFQPKVLTEEVAIAEPIETQSAAQEALENINYAIFEKDQIRADLGAQENRLENTITNLTIQKEQLTQAESRISDIDVATEMTEFTRNNIMAQVGASMLAQANTLAKLVLSLLG